MKPLSILGLVLLVLGLVSLVYGGLFYTSKDTVVDAGPIQISADKKHGTKLPPLVGGLMVVAGLVLVVVGGKRSSAA